MGTITTTDGTEIFYKDWEAGQPWLNTMGWPGTQVILLGAAQEQRLTIGSPTPNGGS
jgi:hypothetical protein